MSKMSRRFFLRGVGGAALALPVLPSLFKTEKAWAQAVAGNRIFLGYRSSHGCRRQDMFPASGTPTQQMSYAGHTVRRGPLTLSTSGGVASLSPVLSAPTDELTATMAAKMNVLQGLDRTWDLDHHYGRAAFGNMAQSISFSGNSIATTSSNQRPTIDQMMAWSDAFYSSLEGVQHRFITLGYNEPLSYMYSNPETKSGSIQEVRQSWNSSSLYDALFPTPPEVPEGTPLVDLVLEDYKRFQNSNRRLSAADRARVDDHMQRMDELQRRLTTVSSCTDLPPNPGNNDQIYNYSSGDWQTRPDKHVAHAQMMNEVLAMGLACGATRVAVMNQQYPTSFSTKDWNTFHDNGPGHFLHNSEAQGQEMAEMKNLFFRSVVLDMARRLEAMSEGDGKTALDRALVVWHDEHGHGSHSSISVPAILFGSAGGSLQTGSYCDYRNQGAGTVDGDRPGLTYPQFWGTVMQAMGVPHSEWQEVDHGGYGKRINGGNGYSASNWPTAVWNAAGDILPYL